ncbi:MAG: M3 family metallopeptidase [Lentimicrobiaceae bacterium]|jgi:peptidyl-dipeptidase Dcp|nr:M3 family metallopeptidase [Lentimicrobiaceae bacterium]MDD4596533.1 M3 family metallopeptidase [Lentimicrobiaceae bacterium]MDY0026776.1 M3 family metallopeptidase [Lentimicrobium sp.]HAH58769.1 peptidase M3 [Bacteroidales bacterium]
MRKIIMLLCASAVVLALGCKQSDKTMNQENPFFSEYTTPFHVPPFDNIKTSDYMPAFNKGMEEQNAEVAAITANKEAPDFENTILAYDKSGKILTRVSNVFFNLNEANTSDELQEIARTITPMMSKHRDEISMNPELFARIKEVYEKRNESNLDEQQIRVVEKYYRDFERRGANLEAAEKQQLKDINERLATLRVQFGENQLAEVAKNFKLVVDNEADLAGLPQAVIVAAAETAKSTGDEGKWVFTLSKPSLIPFLQYADNRDLREKIYRGYYMRGNNDNANDNKKITAEIVKLRAQKARLLGFDNFAAYVIDENMAKTTQNVDTFLNDLLKPAMAVAKKDLAEMQQLAKREGADFELQSWDWWYYAEKLRKQKFDLDETQIKPYLKLENVRDGMFAVANKLYGITFEKRTDLPVYQKDVETFEVKEGDGTHLGILYLDYFPRSSKSGGAWCTGFETAGWEDGKRVDPIVSIVTNFTPPAGDTPSLLSWDETTTLFHEFGHGLHGLFTTGKYTRTAGNVPRDFVELPSQVMENWAGEPEVLKMYAHHYQTGEVMPDSLIAKINNSSKFNQGFETTEYIAASILDMDWHKQTDPVNIDNVKEFEKQSMDNIGLIPEILPRYRTTYFSHIFNGGYAAGYYVYLWAAVLDNDAFDYFKQSGDIFNPEIAARFRQYCLAENGDDEGMIQYKKFRGQEPSLKPLLEKRGLN